MYVEGVANKGFRAGASSRPPVLRMATPLAVPMLSSSNFDCSQVRVPSPDARVAARPAAKKRSRKKARAVFDKFIPREWIKWAGEGRARGDFIIIIGKSLSENHLTVTVRTCVPETT